ncbi:MAG TPA: hypothetical protein VK866_18410 [Acidimicrobiales bacterium]|nr:hypothetical protein [Acidimicrobiales bacterium]
MTGSPRSRVWRARILPRAGITSALVALVALVALAGGTRPAAADAVGAPLADPGPVDELVVELFWMEGCPHCHTEWELLDELVDRYPGLVVDDHEVSRSEAARQRFAEAGATYGFEPRAVPTTIIDGQVWVGFDDRTAVEIEAVITAALAAPEPSGPVLPSGDDPPGDDPTGDDVEAAAGEIIDVPLLGEIDVGDRSLLVATVLIGFVDGVNPCSLWVLSVLLGLVLHSGSRQRVLAVGVTFLVVTTAMYGLYIVGVYTLLAYVAYLTWIQRGVAVVAGTIGAINVWSWAFPDRGPSLSIAAKHKPGIYRRGRELARSDGSLLALMGATAALAVGVSLAETPCTAGFPIIWTGLLADQGVGGMAAVGLFTLYMGVFLLDELLIFGAMVVTMRAVKMQERHGRALKLLSGVVMLALAGAMAFDPDRLSTVGGSLAVFGGAGLVTALVLGAERVLRHPRPHPVT